MQDNGTILVPGDNTFFNSLDGSPVYGGDGFDCAMSQATDLQEGIPFFATSQNGVLGRGFYVSGAPFTVAVRSTTSASWTSLPKAVPSAGSTRA